MAHPFETSRGSAPPSPRANLNMHIQELINHLERLLRRQRDELHGRIDTLERSRDSHHSETHQESEDDLGSRRHRRRHERRHGQIDKNKIKG